MYDDCGGNGELVADPDFFFGFGIMRATSVILLES